jgi:hypothetical protein
VGLDVRAKRELVLAGVRRGAVEVPLEAVEIHDGDRGFEFSEEVRHGTEGRVEV